MAAAVHSTLGLIGSDGGSDEERARMPCTHVPAHAGNFKRCIANKLRGARAAANWSSGAGIVCTVVGMAALRQGHLMHHMPGDKSCLAPLAARLRLPGGGWRDGLAGTVTLRGKSGACPAGSTTLCCAYHICVCGSS